MKVKRLALAVAMIAAITALSFAQKVEFHGYMDYSTYIGGYSTKDGGADWKNSDLYSLYGSWYGGRTEGNMTVTAQNLQFVLGIRLGNDLDTWYDIYYDNDPFYRGYVRADLFNGLMRLWTGKFDEEGFGYHTVGLAWGCTYANDMASRDWSHYFTGVEIIPSKLVRGLSVMAGLPIQPDNYNQGIDSIDADDEIETTLKQFKVAAKYAGPYGMTFMGLYYAGMYNTDETDANGGVYSTSTKKFREAALNLDIPNLARSKVALRAGYDWQQRLKSEGRVKHNLMLSAAYRFIPKLWTAIDGRVSLATGGFETQASTVFQSKAQFKAVYDLRSKMQVGCLGNVGYLKDDTGALSLDLDYGDGAGAANGDDGDLGFGLSHSACRTPNEGGAATEGIGMSWGVNPYLQKNFSNGYISVGLLYQQNNYDTGATNTAITYAIPVNVCFWY